MASLGDRLPDAQASRTADDAMTKSLTFSIFGNSKITGRSRLGGNSLSRQSRRAAISPSNAFSTALRAMALASPSSGASTAIVALLWEPLGRPSGLPLRPALKGRPRCFFAVFSAGGRLSLASRLGVMSSLSPEFDDMLHLLFQRVARPVGPGRASRRVTKSGDTSVEECPGSFSGKLE